jgi:hypothetical protein
LRAAFDPIADIGHEGENKKHQKRTDLGSRHWLATTFGVGAGMKRARLSGEEVLVRYRCRYQI